MKVLHLPSYCLAPVSVWTAMAGADVLIVCEGERFEKSGHSNRYRIAAANGPLLLTIPVVGGRNNRQPVARVRIAYDEDWRRRHAQSWKAAYGKSPFFLHYGDALLSVLCSGETSLALLNRNLLLLCLQLLGCPVKVEFSNLTLPQGPAPWPKIAATYHQVFACRHGFLPDLSIVDLLFNEGPQALQILHGR